MFNASEIKWVKNVKRADGHDWAYFEAGTENEFRLNFSKDQKKGAGYILPGEIILLFQRVDKIPGIADHTYLTHLVTPLDNHLRENNELDHKYKWERRVAVIARANPRDSIFTTPDQLHFKRPQFGKICPVELLSFTKNADDIKQDVWQRFIGNFNENILDYIQQTDFDDQGIDEEIGVLEGAAFSELRSHKGYERNKVIVGIAKQRALKKGDGRILCECCDFDFFHEYGEIGHGFIECHHAIHMKSGIQRITKISDLHMVCSNCHRMLHKKTEKGYHDVSSLKKLHKKLAISNKIL